MKQKLSVNIPFDGFYHSKYSDIVDRDLETECDADWLRERFDIPQNVEIDVSEFWEFVDYRTAETMIARDYVEAFANEFHKETGIDLAPDFEEMVSPREYNFTTDRLFAKVSRKAIADMVRLHRRDGFATLAREITGRHSSRSGFVSFYSNDLASWRDKPVSQWDEKELGTLLRATLRLEDLGDDFEWSVFGEVANESFGYLETAMDWEKFDAAVKAQILEAETDNPDVAAQLDWRAAIAKGQKDLFAC